MWLYLCQCCSQHDKCNCQNQLVTSHLWPALQCPISEGYFQTLAGQENPENEYRMNIVLPTRNSIPFIDFPIIRNYGQSFTYSLMPLSFRSRVADHDAGKRNCFVPRLTYELSKRRYPRWNCAIGFISWFYNSIWFDVIDSTIYLFQI